MIYHESVIYTIIILQYTYIMQYKYLWWGVGGADNKGCQTVQLRRSYYIFRSIQPGVLVTSLLWQSGSHTELDISLSLSDSAINAKY